MEIFLDLTHPCGATSLLAKSTWDEQINRKWQNQQNQWISVHFRFLVYSTDVMKLLGAGNPRCHEGWSWEMLRTSPHTNFRTFRIYFMSYTSSFTLERGLWKFIELLNWRNPTQIWKLLSWKMREKVWVMGTARAGAKEERTIILLCEKSARVAALCRANALRSFLTSWAIFSLGLSGCNHPSSLQLGGFTQESSGDKCTGAGKCNYWRDFDSGTYAK